MKIGTEVRVIDATGSYGGKYCNLVGRVEGTYSGNCGNVAVRLVNMTNPNSAKGLFYFSESELAVVVDPPIDNSLAKTQLNKRYGNPFTIKKVIFNDPAVIILWADDSKTVVKCSENDIFDPEKGLAMAISKKALGNQGNYYNTFKKYLPEEEDIDDFGLHPEASLGYSWIDKARESLDDLIKNLKKPSSKSDKPAEKDEGPHLCSNCKYLCQHFNSTACYGCGPNKKNWEPAELEGE